MKNVIRRIAFFIALFFLCAILKAQGINSNPEPLPADEITPVAVRFVEEVDSNDYAVEKMIGRRLDGYACLNDESRTGSRNVTVPPNANYKRNFTRSYLTLTNNGKIEGNNYLSRFETRNRSVMSPPYFVGSSIFDYLSPDRYGVNVSKTERRIFAHWIDLLIPFCEVIPSRTDGQTPKGANICALSKTALLDQRRT